MSDQHPFGPGSHAPLDEVHDMPQCYPIKGNADSMKYHRPDSQGYERTKAEVWFVSPSVAEAAGFILAGSHPEGSSSADFEPGGSGHPCSAAEVDSLGLLDGAGSGSGTGAAVAAAGVGGVAGAAALTGSGDGDMDSVEMDASHDMGDVEEVTKTTAPAAAVGDGDSMYPFGEGSHAPLADVHEMPECFPIKGNADSMKYHRPDSQGYERTKAEVWFVSPSVAEAAGFILAGSHPEGSSSADFEPGASGHPCVASDLDRLGLGSLGFSTGTKVAAGAAGVAAVAGGASLLDGDETELVDSGKAAADKAAAEEAAAELAAAEKKAADDKIAAEKKAADDKIAAEKKAADDKRLAAAKKADAEAEMKAAAEAKEDEGMGIKGVAAAGVAGAAAVGAAALLGGDDDDVTKPAAEIRETAKMDGPRCATPWRRRRSRRRR